MKSRTDDQREVRGSSDTQENLAARGRIEYRSILDSLRFVWPRLSVGGFIVFDYYGFPSCPGARFAVDEFFSGKASVPFCLHTGQAVVFKGKA